jgi:5'-nucleotidase
MVSALALLAANIVTIVSFSDYHSHAVPFDSEGRSGQGGLARAVAYLKHARAAGALVVSGGDMMNAGSPTWSDEYRCSEWPWLNGLVDAMALGNHDLDYGSEVFARCRASVKYPILCANLVDASGRPVLGRPYVVKTVGGHRIGLFALAGPDFAVLVPPERLPPGTRWSDRIEAARSAVRSLRETARADVVVLIGHEHRADDEALARAVPGIDLVLGSHSHLEVPITRIEATQTVYVSPYQYLAYVAEVRLRFAGHRLVDVTGGLVRLDDSHPEDPEITARVAGMERQLVARHPERFRVIGRLPRTLSDADITTSQAPIGSWATEELRRASAANVFFSTASSFRASLPAGEVTVEAFHTAVPYTNRVVTAEMSGKLVADWMALSASRSGADSFSQVAGLREAGGCLEILLDPSRPEVGYAPLDLAARYRLGTTDYQAFVVPGYKELFAQAENVTRTEIDVHAVLRGALSRIDDASGDDRHQDPQRP